MKATKKVKRKIKKAFSNFGTVYKDKGLDEALLYLSSGISYYLYDKSAIARLKKMPPKLKKNQILFQTNNDFSDNCRALFDYMIANGYNQKYKMVWLVNEPRKYRKYVKPNVRFVRNFKHGVERRTAKAYRYALSSRYIFYTQAFNWIGMARKDQVFVNLWHGCGYKANKNDRKVFFDYVLVPGSIFIETKKEFFGCNEKKILPIGYPRYDMMLQGSEKARAYSDRLLSETGSEKIILWMPTYRHASSKRLNEETLNNEFNLPIVNCADELIALDDYCRNNHLLLIIKKHYLQIPYDFGDRVLTNILYLEDKDLEEQNIQLYEFIPCSDALISDYSSVAIDYLLLNKPIGYTLDDYDAYTESRGWVFENPLEYMPGEHIYNLSEFKSFLNNVKEERDLFVDKRQSILSKTHNPCENYCQRILDYFEI